MFISLENFKKRIEFSMVPHFLNESEIEEKCISAINAEVGVICVNPNYVKFVKALIGKNNIKLSANISFPWGTNITEFKVLEAQRALSDGADQLDMVIDVGALRSGKYKEVLNDIRSVVRVAGDKCIVKAIIETWCLSDEQKIIACKIVEKAGAKMVKTTTGVKTQYLDFFYNNKKPRGGEIKDIILLRQNLSPSIKIKVAGGVYSLEDAFKMIKAGADQIGASKGISLIKEFEKKYLEGIDI